MNLYRSVKESSKIPVVRLLPSSVAACTAVKYSQDPAAQYLFPSKSKLKSLLKEGLQVQPSEAQAADLLFQAADFAAAAWCCKAPEELAGLRQLCMCCTHKCHTVSACTTCSARLQRLKAASQELAKMSDSKEDEDHGAKYEQFKKAVNEQ